jgi:ABC-type sugar transport system permease subunit
VALELCSLPDHGVFGESDFPLFLAYAFDVAVIVYEACVEMLGIFFGSECSRSLFTVLASIPHLVAETFFAVSFVDAHDAGLVVLFLWLVLWLSKTATRSTWLNSGRRVSLYTGIACRQTTFAKVVRLTRRKFIASSRVKYWLLLLLAVWSWFGSMSLLVGCHELFR